VTNSPSARALEILGRFPRHLALDDPGTLFGVVVDCLAEPLEAQTSQVGRVRRAHRLGHADETVDLLKLAALHRLREADFELLATRLRAVRDASPPGFAGYDFEVNLLRSRVRAIIATQRAGNGTVRALLEGAANALDLDVTGLRHSFDRFWHEARCSERIRPSDVEPDVDLLFLEENPLRDAALQPVERRHAEKFLIRRAGFEPVPTAVVIKGIGDRTVFPMVVQRDAGIGVAFTGSVPDGQELRFGLDGEVTLNGANRTTMAYAFSGGVFTDEPASPGAPPHPGDFLFADASSTPGPRTARFATTIPVDGAFDPAFVWPRAAGDVPSPTLAVGDTRWAFFVRVAHFGAVLGNTAVPAAPLPLAGVFDQSVWASETGSLDPSAKVGFAWREREPFAVKVWIPQRFAELDVEGAPTVREEVRTALDRYRAAGVHVYVSVAEELVPVGGGVLPADAESDEIPEETVVWPEP
jgi:hypothetical protein